jgi:hypothetical protein
MRRFVTLLVLLLFSIPFGVSISGCSKNVAPVYCNGGDSGVTTAQPTTITLNPIVYGISLNFAEIGQVNTPSATNCKGANASIQAYTYSTTDMTVADVQPTSGRLCGGTWNRNTGGGIPDYTYCIPTNKSGIAYISASAEGVTSNPLPIFIHPTVTSIVLGGPSTNCATDPASNCSAASIDLTDLSAASAGGCPTSTAYPNNPQLANGCCSIPTNVVYPVLGALPYSATSCYSQGSTSQLSARVYAGTGANQTNISCLAGHLQYSAQGAASTTAISPVVSIDPNGVATANQPGSVLISADISDAASSAGFFSTCPPASITLTTPGSTSNPVVINENNTQPLTATVLDTNGKTLTGLTLEYVSTSPITIPAGSGSIIPPLAGAASVYAICQPTTSSTSCNSSSYNQIGLFGNGKPVISNPVNLTAPGTNSTVLYMASTQSQYVETRDFTQNALAAPFLLPYVPNSMMISNDGSTIYMGSSTGLMVLNAVNTLNVTRVDTTSPGTVIGLSPDGNTLVLSDPVKQITTLESSSGSVLTTYGGVGTHAEFSPDDQTVYITAGNQLLIYSSYTGWTNITPATTAGTPVTDVAITVPSVGAYFAGQTTTARGYCSASTQSTVGGVVTETNSFYPPADSSPVVTDRIAATNDGLHILGATAQTTVPTLSDIHVTIPIGACPVSGGLTFSSSPTSVPLSQISTPSASGGSITGVIPASDSSIAFITYSGTGGAVPAYAPASGTVSYVKLSGTAIAPLTGVISSDNTTFYAGTSGDNLVHLINRSTLIDVSTLAPNLTAGPGQTVPQGTIVPVNLMAQKPRKTT